MAEQKEIVTIRYENGNEQELTVAGRTRLTGKSYAFLWDETNEDMFVAEESEDAYHFVLEDDILEKLGERLRVMLIKAVVCIDIGDGTCTACAMRVDDLRAGKVNPEILLLDDKSNVEIAAALYYHKNGSIEIGYREQLLPEGTKCITNFKRCPPYEKGMVESWDTGNPDMDPMSVDNLD